MIGGLFSRLVANTVLAIPDDVHSCWLWTGRVNNAGYPQLNVRAGDRKHKKIYAHRAMLEEVHDVLFPHDEAGHLCFETRCINPMHLEVQTRAFNLGERRGYAATSKGVMIPTLYPRDDAFERFLEAALAFTGQPVVECPF